MIKEFIELFYPNLCLGCNDHLLRSESFLCTDCLYHLPQTNYHLIKDNPLAKTFWGRVPLKEALAFIYFRKGGVAQTILHELKYAGNQELSFFMGTYYGARLKQAGLAIDGIAAVPLHKSKLLKRGYNQSALFASGMAQVIGCEDYSHNVVRNNPTETQTKKGRYDRWTNVDSVFGLVNQDLFRNKHILIVDDVITTGATIESLAQTILNGVDCTLSVASIATPQN